MYAFPDIYAPAFCVPYTTLSVHRPLNVEFPYSGGVADNCSGYRSGGHWRIEQRGEIGVEEGYEMGSWNGIKMNGLECILYMGSVVRRCVPIRLDRKEASQPLFHLRPGSVAYVGHFPSHHTRQRPGVNDEQKTSKSSPVQASGARR